MLEFKLLYNVIDYMESNGLTYKMVQLTVNKELTEEINKTSEKSYSIQELERAADICFAHDWLEQTVLGAGKYAMLKITPKGVGAARSKRRAEQERAARGILKKTSDYIEDHKGLFIILGFLLGLATLSLKIFGD